MRRREFITLLATATAWPSSASAQPESKTYRIGLLSGGRDIRAVDSPLLKAGYPAFRDELRKRGFIDGRNLLVEFRSTLQEPSKLYADAAELARSGVDVFLAIGPEIALKAAVAASRTIPIVTYAFNFDPMEHGYVQGLSRPGGNVTGVFTRQPELVAKQVEILKSAFPDRTRLAVLWDALAADLFVAAERTAKALHLDLRSIKLQNPPYDIAAAFRRVAESDPQILLVLSSPLFGVHSKKIANETVHYRLPAMFIYRTYVDDGGLMSYGVDVKAGFRRLAEFVAKVLNGERAAELPVEQPTKFELVVNLKTGKEIGIELPTSLLLRADEVIE